MSTIDGPVDRILGSPARPPGTILDYLTIARLDHATKHVFIIPGIMLACLLRGVRTDPVWLSIAFGLAAAVCVASANYVINEWFDRDSDTYHPTKSRRSAVQKQLNGGIVLVEWLAFLVIGLGCAAAASSTTLVIAGVFALQGVVYNVPPLRTKNKAYLDVISESINNPLRLMLGWAMIDPTTLPPSSVLLLYWTGGAFLMAAKRLSEFREIVASHGKARLARYRASFERYSEMSLMVSCFVYSLCSVFFLAVFLIKYRIEYLLIVPIVIAIFAYYLVMSMQPGSSTQKPERLFLEPGFVALICLLTVVFSLTTVVNVPVVEFFSGQRYISLR